jgi:hypothetical protein
VGVRTEGLGRGRASPQSVHRGARSGDHADDMTGLCGVPRRVWMAGAAVSCRSCEAPPPRYANGRALAVFLRVGVEIMGSQKCGIVGESQPVLIMINPMIFTRTRTFVGASISALGGSRQPGNGSPQHWGATASRID